MLKGEPQALLGVLQVIRRVQRASRYAYDSAWNLHYLTNNGALSTFIVDNKNFCHSSIVFDLIVIKDSSYCFAEIVQSHGF